MATELDKILNEPISSREDLIKHLKENTKVFKNKAVEEAFKNVDRKDFVGDDCTVECYEDYPLPIGHGQTISQPTTVAFMLELLNPKKDEKVLDVGSGSGFTTALIANMISDKGSVIGIERIPELVEFAKNNLSKYDFKNIKILKAGEDIGHKEDAPYDKILVSAAGTEISEDLVSQLKIGGVIVAPINNSILKATKESANSLLKEEYPGFVFVPLIEDNPK